MNHSWKFIDLIFTDIKNIYKFLKFMWNKFEANTPVFTAVKWK